MRILTIVHDLRAGGTQRVACNFAVGYRSHGLQSAVLAYAGGGPFEQTLRAGGVDTIIGAAHERSRDESIERALAWKPDVVHIHRAGSANAVSGAILHAVKASTRTGTTAAVGVLETNVFGRVDHSSAARCIDVHFQLSKWCLWRWERWARFQQPRPLSILLPNLVMDDEFQPNPGSRSAFRREYGIPQDALLFGRVGSPIASKWSTAILTAFRDYGARNADAWLLLIGYPPGFREAVEALPATVRKRIRLIEFLHEPGALRSAYAAMDVFLHAAHIGESFGMVLAESMLCGTPVITLSTPCKDNSQLEVVGHESGGLVVADVQGMVQAMQRLERRELRMLYAAQGAANVQQRFAPAILVPRAIKIAMLSAEGLPREVFRKRVLELPETTHNVGTEEITNLLRGCIGRHSLATLALMRLVTNPVLHRTYVSLTQRPT